MIAEYGLTDTRVAKTPFISFETLEPISVKDKPVNINYYRRVISKLLYLIHSSRLDIYFIVSRLSRYMAKPVEKHWRGIIQVLRYTKGTCKLGISFSGLEKR